MTKRIISLMAICAIISLANCSRIEQNNDPIIGIWSQSKIISSENSAKQTIRKEWIFNDVYLGRYHEISGSTITLKTDFNWSREGDLYTIEYRGLEGKPTQTFSIITIDDSLQLESDQDGTLAIRE